MPDPPHIVTGSDVACYLPVTDTVHVPRRADFAQPEAYYATLFHEVAHATGHPRRLNRSALATPAPFGSPDYSQEELVAEIASAFVCGASGIAPATLGSSAEYIAGWLAALRADRRLVVVAAGLAQRAADLILGSPRPPTGPIAPMIATMPVARAPPGSPSAAAGSNLRRRDDGVRNIRRGRHAAPPKVRYFKTPRKRRRWPWVLFYTVWTVVGVVAAVVWGVDRAAQHVIDQISPNNASNNAAPRCWSGRPVRTRRSSSSAATTAIGSQDRRPCPTRWSWCACARGRT